MGNYIAQEKRQAVEYLLRAGFSLRDIADLIGVNRATAGSIMAALGVKRTCGFRGIGRHLGKNQVKEWVKIRTSPLLAQQVSTRSQWSEARAALMEVRRQLHYGLTGTTHKASHALVEKEN